MTSKNVTMWWCNESSDPTISLLVVLGVLHVFSGLSPGVFLFLHNDKTPIEVVKNMFVFALIQLILLWIFSVVCFAIYMIESVTNNGMRVIVMMHVVGTSAFVAAWLRFYRRRSAYERAHV